MAEGEVVYSTRADNSQLDSDLNQAEKKIDSKFSKIGSARGQGRQGDRGGLRRGRDGGAGRRHQSRHRGGGSGQGHEPVCRVN